MARETGKTMLSPRYRVSSKARSYVFCKARGWSRQAVSLREWPPAPVRYRVTAGIPTSAKLLASLGKIPCLTVSPIPECAAKKLQNMAKRFLGGNDGVIHTNQLARKQLLIFSTI